MGEVIFSGVIVIVRRGNGVWDVAVLPGDPDGREGSDGKEIPRYRIGAYKRLRGR